MKTAEITEWVTSLEWVHALVRATCWAKSRADVEGMLGEALSELERLHGRMLAAEIRAVLSRSRCVASSTGAADVWSGLDVATGGSSIDEVDAA